MTLHLFNSSNAQKSIDSKRLLVGYENGSVTLHACKPIEEGKSEQSIEGRGWEEMWTSKLHAEAGVYKKLVITVEEYSYHFRSYGHGGLEGLLARPFGIRRSYHRSIFTTGNELNSCSRLSKAHGII
jgi:hypothetical protein